MDNQIREPENARPDKLSIYVLIAVNLAILGLAMTREWGFYAVLVIYWAETLIVGLYNTLRVFVVFMLGDPFGRWVDFTDIGSRIAWFLFIDVIFVIKFAGYALGSALFVFAFPAVLEGDTGRWGLELASDALDAVGAEILWSIALLFVSHGVSFVMNFLGKKEYLRMTVLRLLFWPYIRILLLVVIMIGAVLLLAEHPEYASATTLAVATVLLKLVADSLTHWFEHVKPAD